MIPNTQTAIQLIGPDTLARVDDKPVLQPGPTQMLAKVLCVGLCFSDMKLLKQFSDHARKGPVVAHLDAHVLSDIPTYVPNDAPTVPGHEVVVEIVSVGDQVRSVETGRRYLVQADWRDLKTAISNGAFGYNFEGGLQQFVLLDERLTIAASGDSYLLPVEDASRSHAAAALVEPWACVEQAFAHSERRGLKAGGNLLLVNATGATLNWGDLDPSQCAQRWCLNGPGACSPPASFTCIDHADIPAGSIDDCIVVGCDGDAVQGLWPLLGSEGVACVLQAGERFAQSVAVPVGRVHYGGLRLIGDRALNVAAAYARIPACGEIRPQERVVVVGAGGPMGVMACLRMISSRIPGLSITACNRNPVRLSALQQRAQPLAAENAVDIAFASAVTASGQGGSTYWWINAPVPELVAQAVELAGEAGIINVFAGIAAGIDHPLNLDAYIDKGLYLIGTSGSSMDDMRVVLDKVVTGTLDTNLSIGAVAGMAGALKGLDAVREGSIPGKIVVYPSLPHMPLMTLVELCEAIPELLELLHNGCWTRAAEERLLDVGPRYFAAVE